MCSPYARKPTSTAIPTARYQSAKSVNRRHPAPILRRDFVEIGWRSLVERPISASTIRRHLDRDGILCFMGPRNPDRWNSPIFDITNECYGAANIRVMAASAANHRTGKPSPGGNTQNQILSYSLPWRSWTIAHREPMLSTSSDPTYTSPLATKPLSILPSNTTRIESIE